MLQRIQSVFLFLACALMIATLVLPLWINEDPNSGEKHEIFALFYQFTADSNAVPERNYNPYFITGLLALVAACIAGYEIFKYKNRLSQMKLGALNSLIMMGVIGFVVYFAIDGQKIWLITSVGEYQVGFFLTPIAAICNILANRFIRRDEKLVRSVDRIR